MGWEERNGKRYYYRKRRVGKTVVSEYVGSGWLGEMQAALDQLERERKRSENQARDQVKAQFRQADRKLDRLEDYARALVRARLLLNGYHPHKGQWRKRRDG